MLALTGSLKALRDIIDCGETAEGRVAKLVRDRARAFVDEVDDQSHLLDDAKEATKDALDVVKDAGDNARDKIEDLF